jgi:hypothetical protein
MIPTFSLRQIDFSALNGKYTGILNFTHIMHDAYKSENRLHGSIEIDGKPQPLYATFEYFVDNKSIRFVGKNDGDKSPFTISIKPVIKFGKVYLNIDGIYGNKNLSHIVEPEFTKIKIAGSAVFNDKEYPVNFVISGSMTGNGFKITGVNNLDRKLFILSVTPKMGIGGKCKIEGSYGAKVIPALLIPMDATALPQIIRTLKQFVIK